MPVALKENIFAVHGPGSVGGNVVMAAVSAGLLVLCMMAGISMGARATWLRLSSVIIALAGGCVVATLMGQYSVGAVGAAAWLTLPRIAFVDFGLSFSPAAILTVIVVYIVVLAETTGTWFAVSAVIERPLRDDQLDRGAVGEGLGCLISALLGSTPVTGYASNAGVIAITGVASRMAFAAAGILLVLFGFFGKLSAMIASIPTPVIGGVFAVLCAVIAMNGFRVIRGTALNERNMLVIGIPILLALFATLAPAEFVKTLPEFVQYFLGSSIAFGAIAAIILHQILPEPTRDKSVAGTPLQDQGV